MFWSTWNVTPNCNIILMENSYSHYEISFYALSAVPKSFWPRRYMKENKQWKMSYSVLVIASPDNKVADYSIDKRNK
jgi:hypothetical protein